MQGVIHQMQGTFYNLKKQQQTFSCNNKGEKNHSLHNFNHNPFPGIFWFWIHLQKYQENLLLYYSQRMLFQNRFLNM